MLKVKENLFSGRISSIDAFRGITIFVMIFVNELASIANVPQWLKHMPAEADAMTFVDVVFPAFLFIVGMSIPFAFNARLKRKDSKVEIWKHTLKRSFALIIIGVFMVNAEYGFDESKMLIPIAVWAFFAYTLPIPVWNKYEKSFPKYLKYILQYGGVLGFIALYFLYVQDSGAIGITPKWWGILGLIGWAYLITVIFYWLCNGNFKALVIFFLICVAANCINLSPELAINQFAAFKFVAGHLTHVTLVVAGIIISLLFFDGKEKSKINWLVIGFGALFLLLGFVLRPYFEISKIRGTPSWTLYSAAICTALFYLLYILMEVNKKVKWSAFFMPAAANPMLIYILPGIIIYFNKSIGLHLLPDYFNSGVPGIIWSLIFSIIMLYVMRLFNKFHIRLHL